MPGEASFRTQDLRDLVEISQFAGRDLLLAQGAGGNTSIKTAKAERVLIKASGFRLADVTESSGYLDLDLPAVREIMDEPALADLSPGAAHDETVRRLGKLLPTTSSLRPSMETGFHLLLNRVVLHTHPVYLNAFSCSEDGREAFEDVCGEKTAWVDYATPGLPLARAVAESCTEYRALNGCLPHLIVLANHGLIATSSTAAEAIASTRALSRLGERVFGALPAATCEEHEPSPPTMAWSVRLARFLASEGATAIVRPARFAALQEVARRSQALTGGPLMPDDAVYGVHNFSFLEGKTSPEDWVAEKEFVAGDKAVVELMDGGVVLVGPNHKTVDFMEENLLANVLIHRLIEGLRRPRYLSRVEVDEILGMESEQYRQALAERASEGA